MQIGDWEQMMMGLLKKAAFYGDALYSLSFYGQPIAYSRLRYKEFGCVRVVLQLLAELGDVYAGILSFLFEGGAPDLLQNVPMGKDFPCIANEKGQQRILCGSKFDDLSFFLHYSSGEVDEQRS
jgi:hypothetical protein